MTQPQMLYRYELRVQENTKGVEPRWESGRYSTDLRVTVIAATYEEAISNLHTALPKPRKGHVWNHRLGHIGAITPQESGATP